MTEVTYNMDISQEEVQILAFKGSDPIRVKIAIKSNITEQRKHFRYLGWTKN